MGANANRIVEESVRMISRAGVSAGLSATVSTSVLEAVIAGVILSSSVLVRMNVGWSSS